MGTKLVDETHMGERSVGVKKTRHMWVTISWVQHIWVKSLCVKKIVGDMSVGEKHTGETSVAYGSKGFCCSGFRSPLLRYRYYIYITDNYVALASHLSPFLCRVSDQWPWLFCHCLLFLSI